MNIRNKFLELRFCICEDESQIDNFVDVADDFAIGFAEWLLKFDNLKDENKYIIEQLLEIYKKENRL